MVYLIARPGHFSMDCTPWMLGAWLLVVCIAVEKSLLTNVCRCR